MFVESVVTSCTKNRLIFVHRACFCLGTQKGKTMHLQSAAALARETRS